MPPFLSAPPAPVAPPTLPSILWLSVPLPAPPSSPSIAQRQGAGCQRHVFSVEVVHPRHLEDAFIWNQSSERRDPECFCRDK